MSDQIAILKGKLRAAIQNHRSASEHLDCGAHLAAVINKDVSSSAREVNRLAAELKKLDPTFPASWTPYPEGT